jgi:tripartite-type tricarboxylate transporter receptor subunit TctC
MVMVSSGLLVGAHPGSGIKTLKDLIAQGKGKGLNFSSGGSGSPGHLASEIFMDAADIKIQHVPYKGNTPAVLAVLSGEVDAGVLATPGMLPHVKAGKIRVLGHWGTGKLESMPDVPSLKDQGFNAEYAQWSGLFVPSGTPEAVVQRLRTAARMAAQDTKAREVIHNAGSPVQFLDSADFEKYVQADIKRMSDVVRRMGKLE